MQISGYAFTKTLAEELLSNLKAYTYNADGSKVIKTKLENSNIYRTYEGKTQIVSFALPDVKEGSIIEVSYSITSNLLYSFRGWDFQYSIPARWSQYTFKIPEYFTYRESSKGYFTFDVNKREKSNMSFTIPSAQGSSLLSVLCQNVTLGIRDVPAFIPEPNTDCDENYIQSLEFELSSVTIPGQRTTNYTQTWESVNKQMLDDGDFGGALRNAGFLKDSVEIICRNKGTDVEKAIALYNWLQRRMKWNNDYSMWATKGLKKPWEDRVGNSGEINLLLTLMLKTAGLNSDPVLFSTRSNGVAIPFYPTISKYNSVLACLNAADGKTYLLDATNKYCPFGLLPPEDINGKGRIINSSGGGWADLKSSERFTQMKEYTLNIGPDGKFTGSIMGIHQGYAGMRYRTALNTTSTLEDYIIKMQENMQGLSVSDHSFTGRHNNYAALCDSLAVEITDRADCLGDKIMFNPFLFEKIEKNNYTLEERKYPVNYNYPISETYRFTYVLPEGFKVESLPKSRALRLEDNSVVVQYRIEDQGNRLVLEYRRMINKIIFLPEEYKNLKALYDLLVQMHSEQVILTKTV